MPVPVRAVAVRLVPNGNMSRDDTLFKDDDGKAYFLSAANNNADLALYELTDDYTDIKRQIVTLWPGSDREPPAIMKANDTYFIVSSGATNWDPNQQKSGRPGRFVSVVTLGAAHESRQPAGQMGVAVACGLSRLLRR